MAPSVQVQVQHSAMPGRSGLRESLVHHRECREASSEAGHGHTPFVYDIRTQIMHDAAMGITSRALRFGKGLWSLYTFNPSKQNTSVELFAIWWVAFPGVAGIAEMGAVRNLQCLAIAANRQITAVAFPVGSG